jgi:DMSO/TMAO reductase YedYZ molybdopterin-dependent catalytic subunit
MRLRTAVLIATLSLPSAVLAADALAVSGDVPHPLHLTADAIREMPHVTVTAKDGHSGKETQFRGVPLAAVLERAGVASGEHLRGKELAAYVMAGAADGYRVVFSIAECDPKLSGTDVLIADAADGKPLDDKTGPLRLVVPRDHRPARWVRQLTTLRVVKIQ